MAPANRAPIRFSSLPRPSAAPPVEGGADVSALSDPVPVEPDSSALEPPVAVALKLPEVGVPLKSCFWPSVGRGDVGTTSQTDAVKSGQTTGEFVGL
jgi:hypothetical protein